MNDDLISRQDAIGALLEKGQRSRRYKLGEIWELNFDEIREALATVPSAEPHWIPVSDALIAPLKEEYKKLKQAFDETSVFQAPNDVALYGALMQEVGAVIGMIEEAKTIDAVPVEYIEEYIEKHKRVALGINLYSADSANRYWMMTEFLKEWRRGHDKTN